VLLLALFAPAWRRDLELDAAVCSSSSFGARHAARPGAIMGAGLSLLLEIGTNPSVLPQVAHHGAQHGIRKRGAPPEE